MEIDLKKIVKKKDNMEIELKELIITLNEVNLLNYLEYS